MLTHAEWELCNSLHYVSKIWTICTFEDGIETKGGVKWKDDYKGWIPLRGYWRAYWRWWWWWGRKKISLIRQITIENPSFDAFNTFYDAVDKWNICDGSIDMCHTSKTNANHMTVPSSDQWPAWMLWIGGPWKICSTKLWERSVYKTTHFALAHNHSTCEIQPKQHSCIPRFNTFCQVQLCAHWTGECAWDPCNVINKVNMQRIDLHHEASGGEILKRWSIRLSIIGSHKDLTSRFSDAICFVEVSSIQQWWPWHCLVRFWNSRSTEHLGHHMGSCEQMVVTPKSKGAMRLTSCW